MDWNYIGGYSDGESSLIFGISQDKSKYGRKIEGFSIQPQWVITSYDKQVLTEIKDFLINQGITITCFSTDKTKRKNQTDMVTRIHVGGWHNLDKFLTNLSKYSIAKKKQYELFLQLKMSIYHDKDRVDWNKESFLEAMKIIDEINMHKSRKRGIYNHQYFEKLWHMGK